MIRDYFWLTDEQFCQPMHGKPHVDDRRIISRIVHVLKSGGKGERKIRR